MTRVWVNDSGIPISASNLNSLESDLTTALGREPALAAGTTSQYLRGDKTWQTLNSAAVGLGSANNTADVDKPVSTAQQTALDAKVSTSTKGAANGVASLDADGFVPSTQHRRYITTVTVSVSSQSGNTNTVTFPAGRFASAPQVFLTKQSPALAKYIPYADAATTSGCTVGIFSGDGTTATGSVVIGVMAIL